MNFTVPVLTCEEAIEFEQSFLLTESDEWQAMQQAGLAIGNAIVKDYRWWRKWPEALEVVVFAGKGHNAADAILAATSLKTGNCVRRLKLTVVWCFGTERLRPLLDAALKLAAEALREDLIQVDWTREGRRVLEGIRFDLSLDGIVGMQFRGEWRGEGAALVSWMNAHRDQLGFRVAVDLPSGMGDLSSPAIADADVTYATGIVKLPAFEAALRGDSAVGRLRYLDLGFFEGREGGSRTGKQFVSSRILDTVGQLRAPGSYKRSFGRVGLLGGSYRYPGAILLATRAALKAGAGLVTGMMPDRLNVPFASVLPEAMWRGLPCDQVGVFDRAGTDIVFETAAELDSLVIGPGMLRDGANLDLLRRLVVELPLPLVLDAGALVPELGAFLKKRRASFPPVMLTPHIGEFRRLVGSFNEENLESVLRDKAQEWGVVIVLKGSVSRIAVSSSTVYALAGNPVLARGGSGDMLAGMLGARLALPGADGLIAAQEAVVWHGVAADYLARAKGEIAVCGSELLDFLGVALRSEEKQPP